jgi:hypothetical protein
VTSSVALCGSASQAEPTRHFLPSSDAASCEGRGICAACRDHAAFAHPLDLTMYLAQKHRHVSLCGQSSGYVDDVFARGQHHCRVAVITGGMETGGVGHGTVRRQCCPPGVRACLGVFCHSCHHATGKKIRRSGPEAAEETTKQQKCTQVQQTSCKTQTTGEHIRR